MIKIKGIKTNGDKFRPSQFAHMLVNEQDADTNICVCDDTGCLCIKVKKDSEQYERILQFAIDNDLIIEGV